MFHFISYENAGDKIRIDCSTLNPHLLFNHPTNQPTDESIHQTIEPEKAKAAGDVLLEATKASSYSDSDSQRSNGSSILGLVAGNSAGSNASSPASTPRSVSPASVDKSGSSKV